MNLLPQSLQRPFHGILFDLDGTIIDSEELHLTAFRQSLQEYGYDPTSLGDSVVYGGSFRTMFHEIARRLNMPSDLYEPIYQRKVEITLEYPAVATELIDGVISFLELMMERRIPMGVVTNSEAAYVDHVFNALDLHQYFDHIVHADHVANPKPAPDAYHHGTKLLQLPASNILVFENSDGGITAAKQADLAVVAIRATNHLGISNYEAADLTVDHFADSLIDDINFKPAPDRATSINQSNGRNGN